jgi:hypothetical protein
VSSPVSSPSLLSLPQRAVSLLSPLCPHLVSSAPMLSLPQRTITLLSLLCPHQCPLLPCSVHHNAQHVSYVCCVVTSVLSFIAQSTSARSKSPQSAVSSPVSSVPVLSPPQLAACLLRPLCPHQFPLLPYSVQHSSVRFVLTCVLCYRVQSSPARSVSPTSAVP